MFIKSWCPPFKYRYTYIYINIDIYGVIAHCSKWLFKKGLQRLQCFFNLKYLYIYVLIYIECVIVYCSKWLFKIVLFRMQCLFNFKYRYMYINIYSVLLCTAVSGSLRQGSKCCSASLMTRYSRCCGRLTSLLGVNVLHTSCVLWCPMVLTTNSI